MTTTEQTWYQAYTAVNAAAEALGRAVLAATDQDHRLDESGYVADKLAEALEARRAYEQHPLTVAMRADRDGADEEVAS